MKNSSGIASLTNLSLTSTFPQRPGHGTQGQPVTLFANYFKILAQSNLNLTRYNVEVTPVAPGRKLRRIFQILFERPEFAGIATDFKTLVISRNPLNIADGFQVDIPYRGEGEDEPLLNALTYTVRVVAPSPIPVSELVKYLSSTTPGPAMPGKEELLNALNALLAHSPVSNDAVASVGPKHFSIDRSQKNSHNIYVIGGGIESLRGFYQSVRPATGGLILNVNVAHGIFLQPERLDVLLPRLGSGNRIILQKKLKLVRIKVTHIAPKKSKTTGEEFPRIKTIFALASPGDGKREPNPPKVNTIGAGPKDVMFYLGGDKPTKDAEGKGKAKGKDKPKPMPKGPALPTETYISVYDYFRLSKSCRCRR